MLDVGGGRTQRCCCCWGGVVGGCSRLRTRWMSMGTQRAQLRLRQSLTVVKQERPHLVWANIAFMNGGAGAGPPERFGGARRPWPLPPARAPAQLQSSFTRGPAVGNAEEQPGRTASARVGATKEPFGRRRRLEEALDRPLRPATPPQPPPSPPTPPNAAPTRRRGCRRAAAGPAGAPNCPGGASGAPKHRFTSLRRPPPQGPPDREGADLRRHVRRSTCVAAPGEPP